MLLFRQAYILHWLLTLLPFLHYGNHFNLFRQTCAFGDMAGVNLFHPANFPNFDLRLRQTDSGQELTLKHSQSVTKHRQSLLRLNCLFEA